MSVHQSVDHPVSLYGATKKANEFMAHAYAHLFNLPVTGLRFFTVYGPWGRPDMSPFLWKILAGEPIDIFNHGDHARDFTYVDDLAEGVVRTLDHVPRPDPRWNSTDADPASSSAPYRLFNIGNEHPVKLLHLVACPEKTTGKTAVKRLLPPQPGEVHRTYADIDDLKAAIGFKPTTSLETSVAQWYRRYYAV